MDNFGPFQPVPRRHSGVAERVIGRETTPPSGANVISAAETIWP
jgi:hypothetical protein